MDFKSRVKFYLIGFFIGIFFLTILFGDKMFSCSYFPNDRVLAEIKLKKLAFSSQAQQQMKTLSLTEKFISDSILTKGKINFDESQAQANPCPKYIIYYKKKYKLSFTKCDSVVSINNIEQPAP